MRGLKKVRAIERAISAEVELREYHALTLAQTEIIRALKVENTLLRKVVGAARDFINTGEDWISLRDALTELDKE